MEDFDTSGFRLLEFRNTGQSEGELKKKIQRLFDEAKNKWLGVFPDESRIDLSPSHLSVCISSLQNIKLFNSNLQIIDEAFEYLVSKSAKGEKGQYFTPRYVIDMCVKMLNPQPGEYPKLRDDPGASFHLYNPLGLGPGEPEVWFAEGEFDTLCLVEAGLPALGIHGIQNIPDNDDDSDDEAPADSSRASRLNPNWRYLFTGSRVVVMLDNEEKSWAAGRKLANLLEGEVFDRWDDAYGDINEWWIGNRVGMLKTLTRYRYMT